MRILVLLASLALSGCQMTLPHPFADKAVKSEPSVSATIQGDQIQTTALDSAPPPASETSAKVIGAPASEPKGDAIADPSPTAVADQPAEAPVVKSALQIDCERKGGNWAVLLSEGAFCQTLTKDAGKHCKVAGDCEGACLARSQTCAPATPLLGCQSVMDSEGRVQEQCIN